MSTPSPTDISTTSAKRAIIITVVILVLIIIASVISMLVISTTSEPIEEKCGLANDLNTSQQCQSTNSN